MNQVRRLPASRCAAAMLIISFGALTGGSPQIAKAQNKTRAIRQQKAAIRAARRNAPTGRAASVQAATPRSTSAITRQGASVSPPTGQVAPGQAVLRPGEALRALPQRPVGRGGGGNGPRAVDPQAWELLQKMYRPGADYEGVEISNANGMTSEEILQGDTKGRTRREYQSPPALTGDVILTAPGHYYRFSSREHRLYLALWPMEAGDKAARLRALARAGRVRIEITGEQMVANRPATQITISAVTGSDENEAMQVLSLDKDTGIALKTERYNRQGRLLSSTYLRSVTVGAILDPKLFDPNALPAAQEKVPLFPGGQPAFASVDQARGLVGFAIKEPTRLPPGYALDGVWVFGQAQRASVLLRYSSGVNHFSLFESPVINPNALNRPPRPAELRPRRALGGLAWRVVVPGGLLNLIYTGHLAPNDQQALLDSIQ